MKYTTGLDESGMGCLASSLFVCGVKAPENWTMDGLKDSKKLSKKQRETMAHKLFDCQDIAYLTLEATNHEIDAKGLGVVHKTSMASIIDSFWHPEFDIIIDGNLNPKLYQEKSQRQDDWSNVRSIIKADSKYPTVMAASIIAKYHKDLEMEEKDKLFPVYNWKLNAGYLTKDHIEAIKQYGLTEFHRKSYKLNLG